MNLQRSWSWGLQILAAVILGQTLFFKFTGAPESRYIFSTLGLEPWGRIATGLAELLAVLLLLHPRGAWLGAIASMGLMSGALMSHLTKLGIVVQDDGGLLFGLACTVWISSAAILVLRKGEWTRVVRRLLGGSRAGGEAELRGEERRRYES